MSIAINSGFPCRIEAGNTVKFTVISRDFPPATWTLKYVMSKDGAKKLEKEVAPNPDGNWLVTLAAADTANFVPGRYDFAVYATLETERASLGNGQIVVEPNLSMDRPKTTAETLLANVEAAITKLSSGTNQSTNFNGQTYMKKDLGKMLEVRDRLRAEVQGERAATGGGANWKTIATRFVR